MNRRDNGGLAGNYVRVIVKHPDRTVDILGVDNHEITSVTLVTTGGVILTTLDEVILIIHQHAHHGKNKTIQLLPQTEHCKNKVDDRSIKVCSSQHTTTLDKHKVHMPIRNGLPCMPLRPSTDKNGKSYLMLS